MVLSVLSPQALTDTHSYAGSLLSNWEHNLTIRCCFPSEPFTSLLLLSALFAATHVQKFRTEKLCCGVKTVMSLYTLLSEPLQCNIRLCECINWLFCCRDSERLWHCMFEQFCIDWSTRFVASDEYLSTVPMLNVRMDVIGAKISAEAASRCCPLLSSSLVIFVVSSFLSRFTHPSFLFMSALLLLRLSVCLNCLCCQPHEGGRRHKHSVLFVSGFVMMSPSRRRCCICKVLLHSKHSHRGLEEFVFVPMWYKLQQLQFMRRHELYVFVAWKPHGNSRLQEVMGH